MGVSRTRPSLSADQTPSRLASGRELLQKFRELLTDDERQIADLRARGTDWAGVAALLGGTPDGRRKQLARAVVAHRTRAGAGFGVRLIGPGPDVLSILSDSRPRWQWV